MGDNLGKFCPSCGYKTENNIKFCPKCGYKFTNINKNSQYNNESGKTKRHKSFSLLNKYLPHLLILGIIILVVFIIFKLDFLYFGLNKNQNVGLSIQTGNLINDDKNKNSSGDGGSKIDEIYIDNQQTGNIGSEPVENIISDSDKIDEDNNWGNGIYNDSSLKTNKYSLNNLGVIKEYYKDYFLSGYHIFETVYINSKTNKIVHFAVIYKSSDPNLNKVEVIYPEKKDIAIDINCVGYKSLCNGMPFFVQPIFKIPNTGKVIVGYDLDIKLYNPISQIGKIIYPN